MFLFTIASNVEQSMEEDDQSDGEENRVRIALRFIQHCVKNGIRRKRAKAVVDNSPLKDLLDLDRGRTSVKMVRICLKVKDCLFA
jgi:hypothetical protein